MSQCIHPVKSVGVALLLLVIAGAFGACAKSPHAPTWSPGDSVPLRIGAHTLQVELALTPASQARGLMKRESLAADAGMLFIFDRPGPRSFWMKNTWIPLDIAYIDASGIIREIHPLYPNNQNSVASASRDIQFALETNRGWFKSHGVRPGAQVDFDTLLPILRDHGIRLDR